MVALDRDLAALAWKGAALPLPTLSLIRAGGLPLEGAQVVLEAIAAGMPFDDFVRANFVVMTPDQVLRYLGRYTHRVAISNNRILHADDRDVTFSYRDRRNNVRKEMTLQAREFIRRFLLHVLPQGFMRIRSFGFLANRIKKQSLAGIREILGQTPPEQPGAKTTRELLLELAGVDIVRCPECGKGHMKTVSDIPARISRTGWITSNAGVDSS